MGAADIVIGRTRARESSNAWQPEAVGAGIVDGPHVATRARIRPPDGPVSVDHVHGPVFARGPGVSSQIAPRLHVGGEARTASRRCGNVQWPPNATASRGWTGARDRSEATSRRTWVLVREDHDGSRSFDLLVHDGRGGKCRARLVYLPARPFVGLVCVVVCARNVARRSMRTPTSQIVMPIIATAL